MMGCDRGWGVKAYVLCAHSFRRIHPHLATEHIVATTLAQFHLVGESNHPA